MECRCGIIQTYMGLQNFKMASLKDKLNKKEEKQEKVTNKEEKKEKAKK